MAEHGSIRSRAENVVFVRFRGRDGAGNASGVAESHTCAFCSHWYGDGIGSGRCLADCGARATPAKGHCRQWRRPPLLTLV